MTLAKRLEQRLLAAVGTPTAGDFNYLADVVEIVRDNIPVVDQSTADINDKLTHCAAVMRLKARQA